MITKKPRSLIKEEAVKVLDAKIEAAGQDPLLAHEAKGILRGLELANLFVGTQGLKEMDDYRKKIQNLIERCN